MKKVLVINGNPNPASLGHSLAETYYKNALKAGKEVEIIHIHQMSFNPVLTGYISDRMPDEPAVVEARQKIKAAEHIVLVYPVWWGSTPALLKGFIDRVFSPGFAFKYHKNDPWWDKLLTGKTAEIIVTMDSPSFWDKWVYFRSSINSIKKATFWFCGIKTQKVTIFDSIRDRKPNEIEKIIEKVAQMASKAS